MTVEILVSVDLQYWGTGGGHAVESSLDEVLRNATPYEGVVIANAVWTCKAMRIMCRSWSALRIVLKLTEGNFW
jgi:hypothetical protein